MVHVSSWPDMSGEGHQIATSQNRSLLEIDPGANKPSIQWSVHHWAVTPYCSILTCERRLLGHGLLKKSKACFSQSREALAAGFEAGYVHGPVLHGSSKASQQPWKARQPLAMVRFNGPEVPYKLVITSTRTGSVLLKVFTWTGGGAHFCHF